MEPFEISLTFIRVLGEKKNKKINKQHRNYFRLYRRERSWGIQKPCQMFECLFIDLFGTFLILCLLCRTLRLFPNHLCPTEKVVYFIFFVLSGIFPSLLQEISDWSLSFLAWSSSPLSHLPTGHKSLLFEYK